MTSVTLTTSAAEGLPRRRFTVADLEAMVQAGILDADERVELIGGELVPMSPKGDAHEDVKVPLVDHWIRRRTNDTAVAQETAFRPSEFDYFEPDIIIFPRAIPRRMLKPQDILLIVEISDSSLRYDMNQKSLFYARLGIRELWVIDAVKRTTHVFLDPSADGYKISRDYSSAVIVTPVFAPSAFALRLEDLEQTK
jgi:Uma2 family endonuclease